MHPTTEYETGSHQENPEAEAKMRNMETSISENKNGAMSSHRSHKNHVEIHVGEELTPHRRIGDTWKWLYKCGTYKNLKEVKHKHVQQSVREKVASKTHNTSGSVHLKSLS